MGQRKNSLLTHLCTSHCLADRGRGMQSYSSLTQSLLHSQISEIWRNGAKNLQCCLNVDSVVSLHGGVDLSYCMNGKSATPCWLTALCTFTQHCKSLLHISLHLRAQVAKKILGERTELQVYISGSVSWWTAGTEMRQHAICYIGKGKDSTETFPLIQEGTGRSLICSWLSTESSPLIQDGTQSSLICSWGPCPGLVLDYFVP